MTDLNALAAAVSADPQRADLRVELGRALIAAGRSGDALDVLRRALVLEPSRLEAYEALGAALAAEEDHIGAIATLEGGLAMSRKAGRDDLTARFESALRDLGPGKRSRAGLDEAAFRGTARSALERIAGRLAAHAPAVKQRHTPDVLVLEAPDGARLGLSVQATPREIWYTSAHGELRFKFMAQTQHWRAGGGEELYSSTADFVQRHAGLRVQIE